MTGSTSGIGRGIARALGGAGANLLLNRFGDAAQIEALRAGVAEECGVQVANLSSVFHATQAALPGMKVQDWGRIVNIASTHGLVDGGWLAQ